jgi:hypothetical protein
MSKTPFKLKSGNSPLFKHMGSSPAKLTYAEAHAKADQALYGNLSLEEYTAEAKRQQASKKAGKGWDAPTKPMESTTNIDESSTIGMENSAGDKVWSGTSWDTKGDKTESTVENKTEPFKPLVTSRKERRQEKLARKSSDRLSRKEIKHEKLASKAESALAKGKKRKAKRLLKRANKKLRSGGVNTTDAGVGKTSDRLIDLDFS